MTKEGQYIYAIVGSNGEKNFGPIGIGDRNDEVYTVCYRKIGALISSSPIVKYHITRANTMTHQRAMEEVMKHGPILPVRFGTIGEGVEVIKEKVLKARYEELEALLRYVEDKIEIGLKVIWKDMDVIFQEIVEEGRDIRMLRDRLMSKRIRAQAEQVRLGEMVKKALEARKKQEEKAIFNNFKGLWIEHKSNKAFGDQMVTNSAFLVKKDREKMFDQAVNNLAATSEDKMKINYVGPVPPCNFVEITVTW